MREDLDLEVEDGITEESGNDIAAEVKRRHDRDAVIVQKEYELVMGMVTAEETEQLKGIVRSARLKSYTSHA